MSFVKGLAAAGLVTGALVTACAEPGVSPIVGPDGSAMLHVHCGGDQAACFQIAGRSCPHGYDMSPIFDVSQGNFLVRCREAGTARVATTTDPSAWRPNSDVVPLRSTPASVTNRELPPTSRTAAGEVD